MWELIRANKRKSVVLVICMALILCMLGFLIGLVVMPLSSGQARGAVFVPDFTGGFIGLAIAIGVWAIMLMVAFSSGDSILLKSAGALHVEKRDHPMLCNVVEEMTIASGMGTPPKVYIMDTAALNAFAVGQGPKRSSIAVTRGLLTKLNRDELQGVVAHEMAHIVNRDVLFMTIMATMLGSIVLFSDLFLRGMFIAGHGRRRSRNSSGGGQAQAIIAIVGVVLAILAPIIAQLLYYAASRRREYLADASAALYTRYPAGLASALDKIANSHKQMEKVNRATAPMFISNPKKRNISAWSSTHPPISERIRILQAMGGTVSLGTYQSAWKKLGSRGAGTIPGSALAQDTPVQARAASPEDTANQRTGTREVSDLLRRANGFFFIACTCGMKMKIPPDFKHETITCPRCKTSHAVPLAQLAAMDQMADAIDGASGPGKKPLADSILGGLTAGTKKANPKESPLQVRRPQNREWFSFKCTCGHVNSLSPLFRLNKTKCKGCGREILIKK